MVDEGIGNLQEPPPGLPSRASICEVSLTQNLVQLHDGRIGTDAVHRLGPLGGLALLKHLLILVACGIDGRHGESIGPGDRRSIGRELRRGNGKPRISTMT